MKVERIVSNVRDNPPIMHSFLYPAMYPLNKNPHKLYLKLENKSGMPYITSLNFSTC